MDGRAKKRYAARLLRTPNAPVAQLDRVLVSEAKGHRFDSCRARHIKKGIFLDEVSLFIYHLTR